MSKNRSKPKRLYEHPLTGKRQTSNAWAAQLGENPVAWRQRWNRIKKRFACDDLDSCMRFAFLPARSYKLPGRAAAGNSRPTDEYLALDDTQERLEALRGSPGPSTWEQQHCTASAAAPASAILTRGGRS